MRVGTRIAVEATVSAVVAFLISLVVFAPVLSSLDSGWSGGDMLSTYVNTKAWGGISYQETTQFGFPLGMNLNYFPGVDITQNTFALVVNNLTGSTFLGINLLLVLSFPLVAALAYLTIRMTRLQGPLAIALAVAFTFIPYHWGRGLGHTYLATLYSAVTGVALVLLIGSGLLAHLMTNRDRRRRVLILVVVTAMVMVVAWSGVYYVAFTLILGCAALIWRFAQRAAMRTLVLEAVPFAGVMALAVIGAVPAMLTVRGDPPLASLGERLPYESVIFAGNLAMALLPLPQSALPGLDFYNRAVVDAIHAAPYGESTAITNHGTWITSVALLVFIGALILRSRRSIPPAPSSSSPRFPAVTLGYIGYLIVVVLLFFIPWGLNYLLAGTITAQIRGWNRLLPVLLLLFLLGAAAALQRTRVAERWAVAVPIALVILGLAAVDSVLPFKAAYAASVSEAGEPTQAARDYAVAVNAAIPQDCGVLQLPYMAYPEFGLQRGINDYDHFWTSITNPGKQWSYGAVKYTDASIWASQLPQVPSDEQVELLRQSGFCAIHLDTRGYVSEALPPITQNLTERFGAPVAAGFKDQWQLYALGGDQRAVPTPAATAFLHQPMITPDPVTVGLRGSILDRQWVWTTAGHATLTLTPTEATSPVTGVSGAIGAPACGVVPVTVTLTAGDQQEAATVIARPDKPAEFDLTLPRGSNQEAVLSIDAPGEGCAAEGSKNRQFAQVVNFAAR